MTWKAKGTLSIGGADNDFTSETTIQGLDHVKAVFKANFNGNEIEAMTVIAGDKGSAQIRRHENRARQGRDCQ